MILHSFFVPFLSERMRIFDYVCVYLSGVFPSKNGVKKAFKDELILLNGKIAFGRMISSSCVLSTFKGVVQYGQLADTTLFSKEEEAPQFSHFAKFSVIVSSEDDYDFLQFYINGNKQGEWSGIDNSWSFVSYPVMPGINEFEWEYDKDGAVSDGQDCAWLDYIVFPPIDLGQNTSINIQEFNFEIFPNPTFGVFNLIFNDKKS